MLNNLLLVASQVGTLFLMMGVGFLLSKAGKLSVSSVNQITFLLLYVVVPCLVVDALQTEKDPALLHTVGVGFVVLLILYGIYAGVIMLLFRRQPADTRDTLRFGVLYGNVGFMGIPLIRAVLGERGLIYATISLAVFTLLNWSHGVVLMGGRKELSLKKLVLNPGILGTVVGIVLFLLEVRLPATVGDAVSFLGSMNTPLAMVIIGAQMAQANLRETFRDRRLYLATLFKLVIFPLAAALALVPLKLDPMLYSAIVILLATPTAGTTAMFAQQFRRDPVIGAEMVSLSTLLSIISLPVFAVVAKALGGA